MWWLEKLPIELWDTLLSYLPIHSLAHLDIAMASKSQRRAWKSILRLMNLKFDRERCKSIEEMKDKWAFYFWLAHNKVSCGHVYLAGNSLQIEPSAAEIISNSNNLQKLTLHHTNLSTALYHSLSSSSLSASLLRLQHLVLHYSSVSDSELACLAQHSPHIQSLELKECNNISDEGLHQLFVFSPSLSLLSITACPLITMDCRFVDSTALRFKNLFLCNCDGITSESLETLSSHTSCLASFTYIAHPSRGTPLPSSALGSITSHWNSSLTSLEIHGCEHIASTALSELILSCSNLNTLKLKRCSDLNCDFVYSLSTHGKRLRTLELGYNEWLHDDHLKALIRQGNDLPRLTRIMLPENFPLSKALATMMLDALPSLRELSVGGRRRIFEKRLPTTPSTESSALVRGELTINSVCNSIIP